MMGNYEWSAVRAKNFLKKLNERGYTDSTPTNYVMNMKALATQIDMPVSSVLIMNPFQYGLRVFRPQDAHPFLQELFGHRLYDEMVEAYESEQNAVKSLMMLSRF